MTLQKTKLRNFAIIVSAGIVIFLFLAFNGNSCGIRHVVLLNDLQKYNESLDPEFCYALVEKINTFNDQCVPEIEILDCG